MRQAIMESLVKLLDGDNFVILCLTVVLLYVTYAWGMGDGKELVMSGIGGLIGYLGGKGEGK